MNFSDNYNELRSKRKKKKGVQITGNSFADTYSKLREERDDDEIAPVDFGVSEGSRSVGISEGSNDIAPVKKERKWFDKGLFDDGYQFGDITKTLLGTAQDLSGDFAAGIIGMGEKTVDAGAYVAGAVGGLFGADEFQKKTQDFIARDLIDEDKIGKEVAPWVASPFLTLVDYGRRLTGTEYDAEEHSVAGDRLDSLAQSAGQLGATIGLQSVGVPWWLTTGVTSFGGGTEEAFNEGATYGEAGLSAAITAGADILTEKLFAGSGLGESGLINLSGLTKGISGKVAKALADYGITAASEGFEEIAASVISNIGSSLYKEENVWDILTSEEAVDEYIESAIGGMALGGGMNVGKVANSIKTGRDFNTGRTQNEQAVFDKEVESRIAEREKNGTKLTNKEKAAIEAQVETEMERGYISTDTIEEVLGGDTYTAYRDAADSEAALRKEYEELGSKQGATLAEQQRFTELSKQITEMGDNPQSAQLKTKLSEEVSGLVASDRLSESYRERARRGAAFEADVSQYDETQRAAIQKAIDSGILNNTRRTHEFVDFVAKISAEKGLPFDFTNNEKLKETGFAIDGKQVNGYVTKDGVTLNIQAAKSLNSVVGHEISHVLEGTELYTEMQKALFQYAESKGDYAERRKTLEQLYSGVKDANIDAELTADLVGDYLFTDADFINNLHKGNRNVFQKIYDEIKYLCKVATAGSQEARELERVKHLFEQAYKQDGKASGDTKYSLNEFEDGQRFVSVDTDQSLFDGLSVKEQTDLATKIIKSRFQGKVIGLDNRAFVNGKTADEFTHPAKHIEGDIYEAKMRASTELDNLMDAGFGFRNSADGEYGHTHPDAVGGFDYFDVIFKVGTEYYQGVINIKNVNRGKLLKDITKIRNITQDMTSRYGKNPSYAFLRDASMGIEAQNEGNVKKKFSLTEYTDAEKKAHNDAVVEHFGKTYSWAETGYLLLDGTKLDMSGKHEGAPGGYRTVDHRDIVDALGYDYGDDSYSGSLVQFMSEGNIRIIPEMGGINLSVRPTEAQEKALAQYVQMHRGEVVLDIDDLNGYTVASVEYPRGTQSSKVLGDIRAYFEDGTKPEVSGLSQFRSLSKEGAAQPTYGNYNVRGEDVMLETAPVAEDVAPVQDSVQDGVQDAIPDVYVPATEEDVDAVREDSFAGITDADAPVETEAPVYSDEPLTADDPLADRDWASVGKRSVKAYMYENPEVKPYFQSEAEAMIGDLYNTTKGERLYNDDLYYQTGGEQGWMGVKRQTSEAIAALLDNGYTYEQIEKGLNSIIEDNGAENNALSKRIEFLLDERLRKGYTDFVTGYEVPPNQDYINLLAEKQHSEAASADFASITDADAPPVAEDIAPVAAPVAPVAEQYEAIKPKPTKEPRMARATPEEQATAQILTDEPQAEKKKSKLWSKVKNYVIDKGTVFETLSLKTGNRELQARWHMRRNAEAKAQRHMEKSLKPIIDKVEKSGKTKAFYEYLYHMHNIDRMTLAERYDGAENKPVFGYAVTADVSREAAAKLEQANPEFKAWAEDIYAYNRQNREMLVEGDIVSREVADLWEEMYPHYVPVRRAGQEGLNVNVPLDTGRTGVNAPIKRATGGNSDILPLFDTMGQRTLQTYKAIANNRFGVELKNTLGTTIDSGEVAVDEAIDSVDTHEELLQEGKDGKKPTFTVFENGERVTFEITDEMYEAMKPTSEGMATTIKPLNAISNFRRNTLTQYNPWFLLKNAVKDVQDVFINSQHALRTYATIPQAITEMATNGQYLREYLDNGGENNTFFDKNTNTFTDGKGTWDIVKKYTGLNAIAKANDIIERLPRLAEYIASRKAGRSIDVSMLDAARVTTNFAAGGDLTKLLNRNGFTFLNASVQGAVQQVRNVREAKHAGLKGVVGLAAKTLAVGLPALFLNHLMWDDDDEYAELSDYVKQNYYIVGKFGDGKFVRIPKGRMVAVIQDGFLQMENLATGDDEADFGAFLDLVLTNIAPSNPAENNILAPVMDVMQNKTWYGEDLVPTRLQNVPAAEQYDESTDAISRWLGEATDTSPYKWNYLLDQYSGVIGDTLLPMLTPEAETGDNSLGGNMIAPLKDMFTTDSVMNNQNVSDFYDTVDELTVKANSAHATDEDVLKYKYINSVSGDIGELYGQKREIQASDLPDDEKYEQVREIQRQIDEMARESLNTYKGVSITGNYATVGDRHYRWHEPGEDSDAEPGWQKITDKQLEKQNKVTNGLGISAADYWSNKEEYDYAYDNPEKYAVAKAVGGYTAYRSYSSDLYDIKADKDASGKSISGSRKAKVLAYINSMDAEYGEKIILFKSEYTADDTYNYEIIDYLNNREDISYAEMEAILKELGFTVSADGTITW